MHKSLLKVSNLYLNKFIKYLSINEICNIFNNINIEDIATVYYRLNTFQRSRVFSASRRVRNIILDGENRILFMPYIEPVIILNKSMSANTISCLLNDVCDVDSYVREFVVMECECVVYGIIYFFDIMHMFINGTYNADNVDLLPIIRIGKKKCKNLIPFSATTLTDIYKFIVIDDHSRVMGAINIDCVVSQYDLYYDAQDTLGCLYIMQKKSVLHVAKIVVSVFVGAIMSLLLSKYFMFSNDELFVLMLLRCINDIIILIVLEDKVQDIKFMKYICILLHCMSFVCGVMIYLIYNISLAIRSVIFVSVCGVCNSIVLKYIYDIQVYCGIFIILFLPEVVLIFYMYYSRVVSYMLGLQ